MKCLNCGAAGHKKSHGRSKCLEVRGGTTQKYFKCANCGGDHVTESDKCQDPKVIAMRQRAYAYNGVAPWWYRGDMSTADPEYPQRCDGRSTATQAARQEKPRNAQKRTETEARVDVRDGNLSPIGTSLVTHAMARQRKAAKSSAEQSQSPHEQGGQATTAETTANASSQNCPTIDGACPQSNATTPDASFTTSPVSGQSPTPSSTLPSSQSSIPGTVMFRQSSAAQCMSNTDGANAQDNLLADRLPRRSRRSTTRNQSSSSNNASPSVPEFNIIQVTEQDFLKGPAPAKRKRGRPSNKASLKNLQNAPEQSPRPSTKDSSSNDTQCVDLQPAIIDAEEGKLPSPSTAPSALQRIFPGRKRRRSSPHHLRRVTKVMKDIDGNRQPSTAPAADETSSSDHNSTSKRLQWLSIPGWMKKQSLRPWHKDADS